MVRLEEVEDETFLEKSASAGDEVLLADDDVRDGDVDSRENPGDDGSRKEATTIDF